MFENVLHQNPVVTRLRRDVSRKELPPAILFSGPSLGGKLTAGLELARILSCGELGAWNCPCRSCGEHRRLDHQRTILLGNRDLMAEISASAEVLRRDGSDAPRYLLARSARKLLRRFDPMLWEGEEKKLSKIRPVMERLAENIDRLLPGSPLPNEKKTEEILDAVVDDCAVLQKHLPRGLPVAQVRRITLWAVYSSGGDHKTIIIDSAENMPEASRNALLKFLEEPPGSTTIILISHRKSLLLPTIVSRVRDYGFRRRTPAEEGEVLRRVFREDEHRWGGLADYFCAWRTGPSERLKESVVRFLEGVKNQEYEVPAEILDITSATDIDAFLNALTQELRRRWQNDEVPDHQRRMQEMNWIRDARMRMESLNIPIRLIIRSLYEHLGAFT